MPNFIRRWLSRRLDEKLPTDAKRALLVASLSAKANLCDSLHPETLSKLNEVLALCHSPDALRIPANLKSVIWKGEEQILTEYFSDSEQEPSRLEEIVNYVQERAPQWMLYDVKQLKADLVNLYEHRQEFRTLSH